MNEVTFGKKLCDVKRRKLLKTMGLFALAAPFAGATVLSPVFVDEALADGKKRDKGKRGDKRNRDTGTGGGSDEGGGSSGDGGGSTDGGSSDGGGAGDSGGGGAGDGTGGT